ncbi:acyltransferase family protein [Streptosporangium sp. G11]|uniref:acyltransferase family protein n=1 Tax=Streptosporangium sp. G11 TaxID=3436926 RepID=UPI003EBA832E
MTSLAATPSPGMIEGPPRTRLESLTGLRWFAAFGVFFSHVAILLPLPYLNELFVLGTAGVTFFFVLSGYVLTWTFFDRDTAPKFYWRRFARIWPSLLITTVAAVALLVGGQLWPTEGGTSLVWWTVATLLMVQAWFPSSFQSDTVPHTVSWSLSCEAFFYAVFPFVVRPIVRRTLRQMVMIAAVLIAISIGTRVWLWLANPQLTAENWFTSDLYYFATHSPIARVSEFVLGIVIAAAVRQGWRSPVGLRAATAVTVGYFALLWAWSWSGMWQTALAEAANRGSIVVFALLIAAAATNDLAGRRSLLSSRPLVALGQWSYAFYLIHFLVLFPIAKHAFGRQSLYDFPQPTWAHLPYALAGLVVSVLLSWGLYRLYEYPIEKRLRALLRREPKAVTPAPGAEPSL